ncbi:taste receptor type 2 member 7-like [Macrotis lagotis]|uniref:taste receptor type 2 member 7-like n=1 Tax=Macrotis lagotis TaxID=92651 RepID=UPI003D68EF22
MLIVGEKIILILITGEFLLGISGNGFMILVNGIAWIKSKKLEIGDLLLLLLAISRIGLLCIITWISFLLAFYQDEFLTNKSNLADAFWILAHLSSIWFATCLSIFYFLKIANFSHPLFLWLKWRLKTVLCMLQVGPLLFSLSITFPLVEKSNCYLSYRRNITKAFQVRQFITMQVFIIFVSIIPFILSLVSFFFLMLSLWRHTHQMKLNATGSRDPSTEAHVRAMKATLSFLILFVLFYLGTFIVQWNHLFQNRLMAVMLTLPLMLLYPSGHSLILILYNSKLKQAALKMWWQMRCCLQRSK